MELLRRYGCDALADRLAVLPQPAVSLVRDGQNGELNIDLGGGRTLYAGGGERYAAGQVARFLGDPKRINVDAPELKGGLVYREKALYEKTYERFGRPSPGTPPDAADGGYLISFGLGLGLHLPLLVDRLPVRHLIVAEQFIEFLQLSLELNFWEPMLAMLEARGGGVHFAIDTDPSAIANEVYRAIRGDGFAMIDGSYAIQHYNSPVLSSANSILRQQLPAIGFSKGFFEDECLMLRNAWRNMETPGWKRFSGADKPLRDTPVFVIGSGPSIDQSMDAIHRNRENAFVISGGTGLSVLLKNGLRPDLHCELENVPWIRNVLSAHASDEQLAEITLVGSLTVDPRIGPSFRDRVFFFRDSVIPTRLFAEKGEALGLAGPTVTNLASRIALALGARDIYFFGVDLGSPDPEHHHAKSSVYNQQDDDHWRAGFGMDKLRLEVAGNRRERVYTNLPFLMTRVHFNALIEGFPATRFWNCSDGAMISGAEPVEPDALSLPPNPGRAHVVDRWLAAMPDGAGELDAEGRRRTLESYRMAVGRWFDSACAAIDPENRPVLKPADIIDALTPFVKEETDLGEAAAAVALMQGTVLLILQFGYFMHRRVETARKEEFAAFFQAELAAELHAMQGDALAEIDELLA